MLKRSKEIFRLKKRRNIAVDYVLQELTYNTCQRDRAVILNVTFVTLLKERKDISRFPVIWNLAEIQRLLEKDSKDLMELMGARFKKFARNAIRASSLTVINPKEKFEDTRF